MKLYYALFLYRDTDNQLREAREDIQANSLKDAKITARNIAIHNDWFLVGVITGGRNY